MVICFLEESDGAALQFLGGVQLRGLFTILVGASSAIYSLFMDLNDPFRGNFCIKPSTDQLKVIMQDLEVLLSKNDIDSGKMSSNNSIANKSSSGNSDIKFNEKQDRNVVDPVPAARR